MAKKAEEDPPELKALVNQFEELKKRASTIRKRAGDTFMADLKTIPINADIQYARASHEGKDYLKVEKLLGEVQKELDEAESLLKEQEAKKQEKERKEKEGEGTEKKGKN